MPDHEAEIEFVARRMGFQTAACVDSTTRGERNTEPFSGIGFTDEAGHPLTLLLDPPSVSPRLRGNQSVANKKRKSGCAANGTRTFLT
jgi:hypothetical protein